MRRSIALAACGLVLAMALVVSAQVPSTPSGAARDLPSTVLKAFEKSYPTATISTASQERQDGRIAFRLGCLDKGRRRVLVYDLNGAIVEAAEQVNEADLPQPVAAAVHAQRKASYVKGMKVTHGLSVYYELTLRGTRKTTMIVRPDGAVVSFK
jgi:hypothetical protein